jgi:cytochrome b-561
VNTENRSTSSTAESQGSSSSNVPRTESPPGAWREFLGNLRNSPRLFSDSVIRHGRPTSDRAASQAVFGNFFLHVLPTRIHIRSLHFSTTLGLGVITLVLFFLLTTTGIALMVYYKPTTGQAYESMKDIQYLVPTGRFMRNIHRWSAHGMVACVLLHMARAFYTGAYKPPREFNWVVGMLLFVLTLALSFTGYLLPWDQLAFWAVTIGSEIAQSPRELTDVLGVTEWFDPGGAIKHLLLGSNHVGQEALSRFYLLHVMVLPLIMTVLLGVHFWRIRKDGGLAASRAQSRGTADSEEGNANSASRVSEKSITNTAKTYGLMAVVRGRTPAVDRVMADTVPTFPNALYPIAALSMITLAVVLILGHRFDAPLAEMANPAVPENPAKAPWYFLGLQELVSYSALMGGVVIPAIVVIGLMFVPYLDRERDDVGVWFGNRCGRRVCWGTALFATVVVISLLAFTINFGWLRNWYPQIPQMIITFVNPGTVLLTVFIAWSLGTLKYTNSTRMGALATFTCFIVAFVILTYFATVHRGPNWQFYWSRADWPVH